METEERRIWDNGSRCWHYLDENGLLHRDNDKPAIVCKFGDKSWYQHGLQHRGNDKPASISGKSSKSGKPSHLEWFENGMEHRDKGPSSIKDNGNSIRFYRKRGIFEKELQAWRCGNQFMFDDKSCSEVYSTHNKPFTFGEFIEREVEDLGNYEMEDVQRWMNTYNLDMNDKVIWISPDKYEANRYNYTLEQQEEIDDIKNLPMTNLFEYDKNDGFIIFESDDGDNGYLLVFDK